MNKNREPEFVVTDRRRFTSEGETATEQPPEREEPRAEQPAVVPETTATHPAGTSAPRPAVAGAPPPATNQPSASAPPQSAGAFPATEPPEYDAPTAAERKQQEDAFKASASKLDSELQSALGGRSPQDFQMSFERFVASIYMSALMQLGLMREEAGPAPQVDLVGARQTIDTLSILAEKTKGNLTMQEDNLLQNCLYELRMAYVEVTNALTRPPQPGAGGPGIRK